MKKNKILLIAIIIMAFVVGFFMKKNDGGNEKVIKEVKVSIVKTENLSESLFFEGVIAPKNSTPIYLNVPIIIDKILVREGVEVEKGEELIIFSNSTKIELEREVKMTELDIKNIKLQLSDLNSGSAKLQLENRQLEIKELDGDIKALNRQLSATILEDQNLREEANIKKELLDNHAISSIDVNVAINNSNRKKVELADTRASLRLTKQKYNLMVLSYKRLQRELNLQKRDIEGEYEKQKLKKQGLQEKLKKVEEPLTAPIKGIITELFVETGRPVEAGTKLLSIAAEGDNIVKLEIPVQQTKWIKDGQKSKITVRGGFEEQVILGTVKSIARIAKAVGEENYEDRVIDVEISFNNNKDLKPGYSVGVEIEGESKTNLKLVDAFSIFEENKKNYTYVVEDNIVRKTLVEVGTKTLSKFEVLNLLEGTQIVVNPLKVKDGDEVKIKK